MNAGRHRDGLWAKAKADLKRVWEHYDYEPRYGEVADALRGHLNRHRSQFHLALRLPLRAYTLMTPSRRPYRWEQLAGPAAFGTAIDVAVKGTHRHVTRDGFAWRFPLYGIELAWLSRYAPRKRFDSSVALTMAAPTTEAVVWNGFGALGYGAVAAAVPVLWDHRKRGEAVPVRSLRFIVLTAAGAAGLRALARQRARLAEDAIDTHVAAAATTGRTSAAMQITRSGSGPSLKDLMTPAVIKLLNDNGRPDLAAEGEALVRLRKLLEVGMAEVGNEPPRYFELSTLVSGWAMFSESGCRFDPRQGNGGEWVESLLVPSPQLDYRLTFPQQARGDGMRLLTRRQRDVLLTRIGNVRTLDPDDLIEVEDLTHESPNGSDLRIQISSGQRSWVVELPEDDDGDELGTPYDPSGLAFLLQIPWGFDEWRTGYGRAASLVTTAGAATGLVLSRARRLSPAGQIWLALLVQAAGTFVAPGEPALKSDGTVCVNSLAKAKHPALLLAAFWDDLEPWQRKLGVGSTTVIALASGWRDRKTTPLRAWPFEAVWLAQTVVAAAGLSRSLNEFDELLERTRVLARTRASKRAEFDEMVSWRARAERLGAEVAQVVSSDRTWAQHERMHTLTELQSSDEHLARLQKRIDARRGLLVELERRRRGRTSRFVAPDLTSALHLAARHSPTVIIDVENTLVGYGSTLEQRVSVLTDVLSMADATQTIRSVWFVSNARLVLPDLAHERIEVQCLSAARKPYLRFDPLKAHREALEGAAVIGDQPLTDGMLARALEGIWIQPAHAAVRSGREPLWPTAMRRAGKAALGRWFVRMDLEPENGGGQDPEHPSGDDGDQHDHGQRYALPWVTRTQG